MMEKRLSLMEWDIVGLNLNFDNYIFSPPFKIMKFVLMMSGIPRDCLLGLEYKTDGQGRKENT